MVKMKIMNITEQHPVTLHVKQFHTHSLTPTTTTILKRGKFANHGGPKMLSIT